MARRRGADDGGYHAGLASGRLASSFVYTVDWSRTTDRHLMRRLVTVIINYRTPVFVTDCLRSLVPQLDAARDSVIVVDNCSADGSDAVIANAIVLNGWSHSVRLMRSPINGGFSAGNNIGLGAERAEFYMLLNSDTIVRPGAVDALLRAADEREGAGIISPRLEWPDGEAQISCFRDRTPLTEFLRAANTGFFTRLAGGREVGLAVVDTPTEPQWTSFAAVLIRGAALADIGLMDEGYFMYFEDIDYCRRARRAGWSVLNWPLARVVHLRGGSSAVKSAAARRERLPRYYYASRSRYFAKCHGRAGLWLANLFWEVGFLVAFARRLLGKRATHLCRQEWRDNWTNALKPIAPASKQESSTHVAA